MEQWAKDNDYPRLVIKQVDEDVVKSVGPGEDSWKNAIAWADMDGIYKSNFQELITVIESGTMKFEREKEKDSGDWPL